jgi:hypothetical protein
MFKNNAVMFAISHHIKVKLKNLMDECHAANIFPM